MYNPEKEKRPIRHENLCPVYNQKLLGRDSLVGCFSYPSVLTAAAQEVRFSNKLVTMH